MINDTDKKALNIFKKIIQNRNHISNDGIDVTLKSLVSMDEHIWLRDHNFTLLYNEYSTQNLPQPNNTICKNGIVLWKINVRREERKRGGCYRMLMPTFTKVEEKETLGIDNRQGI